MISTVMQLIGTNFCLVYGLMLALWIVYFWQKNAGILDVGWAAAFILVAMADFLIGEGFWLRRLLLFIMIVGWAGRLEWHLAFRFWNEKEEDPRYQEIRKKWFEGSHGRFIVMFLIQAFLIHLLALPFILAFMNPAHSISSWEFLGIAIWLVGVVCEGNADQQLQTFLKKEGSQDKVCKVGLWKYSRHPNYFFEWVIWVGFGVFVLGSPWGVLGIYPPVLIYYLLTKVSGVPLAEKYSLEKRGEAYERYQQETSVFFPWPPKSSISP